MRWSPVFLATVLAAFGCSASTSSYGAVDGGADGSANDASSADGNETSPTTSPAAAFCAYDCPADCTARPPSAGCVDKCMAEYAKVGTDYRTDYITALFDCYKATPCENRTDCDASTRAALSTPSLAQKLCTDLAGKYTSCGTSGISYDECVLRFRVLTDARLTTMRACLTKPCFDYVTCINDW